MAGFLLQNNNTERLPQRQGQVVQANTGQYINQPVQQNLYPVADTTIDNSAMVKELSNMVNQLLDFGKKTQEVEKINNVNEFNFERRKLEDQYKIDYAKNPHDQSIKRNYETDIRTLQEDYAKKTPELFKGQYQRETTQLIRNNDLTSWEKQVNFKVETDKFTRNINLLTQEFYKAGQTGDRELYKNTAQELQRIYPQVIELYGEANAKAIYNEIDSKSTISYLSGLMESNPEEVVSILSEKDSQAAFLIGDNQKANHLKNTAETFAKERKKHKIKQDVANGIITTNSLAEKVLNGNITYDDIEASKILIQDKKDIESIYKLIGIKADGTPYVTKEQEKIKIAENKILVYQNLSERVLDTQIAKPGNQSMEDLKQLESDLLKAVAEGSITKAEWKELSEPIKQTMVQVMGTTTDKEQENVYDEGEVVNGMTNFRENVKKALERNGLPTDIKYYDKNGKMTEEYKKLSPAVKKRIAEINLLYNEKLTDALKEVTYNYALNNNLQYIDPWTMLSLMSGKDQQETFRKANFLIEKSIATQRGIKDVDKMSPQEVLQVNYTYDIQQNQNYVIDSMNKDPILKNTTHSILTDPDLIEAQRKATENEDDLGLEFDLDFN